MNAKITSVLLLALLLGLSGCAALGQSGFKLGDGKIGSLDITDSLEGFVNKIRTFASADVLNAYELAVKSEDKVASICWQVTYYFLQQKPLDDGNSTGASATGLATIIQTVRNTQNKVDSGVPSELRVACAALYNDVRRDALAIAALVGSRGAIKLPNATRP